MQADGARALAGGTDLIPQLREGRREAAHVVDLKRIPELVNITTRADGSLVLGAAASASSIARHAARRIRLSGRCRVGATDRQPAGAEPRQPRRQYLQCGALGGCGSGADLPSGQRARSRDPAESARSRSRPSSAVPARRASDTGELLVSIILPPTAPRSAAKYLRFTPAPRDGHRHRRGRRLDTVSARTAGSPRHASCWHRWGRSRSGPPRPSDSLPGKRPASALFEAAGKLAAADAQPISDTRGSADYRRTLVAVLTARALADCRAALHAEHASA